MHDSHADLSTLHPFQTWVRDVYGMDPQVRATQVRRYTELARRMAAHGHRRVSFFSAPGRTELAGNHTDHSQGRVLAGAIDLDAAAVAAPRTDGRVLFHSAGFPSVEVKLTDLQPVLRERGSTAALVRGIACRFKELGHHLGGFEVEVQSDVMVGSGLSSSAVVEVLLAHIFNVLYNGGRLSPLELASIGQAAENRHYHKPCGLMDQIACATGGVVAIDFRDPVHPATERLEVDLDGAGYGLVVVHTGTGPADLADEYAAIAWEMKTIAALMGKESLREVDEASLLAAVSELRGVAGDRAILRALHFLLEDARVARQVDFLRERRFQDFLGEVRESSASSFRWLQNIYATTHPREQGLTLALALTERFLAAHGGGACRVHGGGFAGTIQAWVPEASIPDYRATMAGLFGDKAVKNLKVRPVGTTAV